MEKEEEEEEEQEEAEEEAFLGAEAGADCRVSIYVYRNLSMYHDHSVYSCSFAETARTLCTTGGTTVLV